MLALRLFLPESWTSKRARLERSAFGWVIAIVLGSIYNWMTSD
jgi:hypothetical protein